MIDCSYIEKLHAAARRERSEHVHRLIQRAISWLLARLRIPEARGRMAPCC
jgi:hypothetical protein